MEDVFELDPECPYWQSDVDAAELLENHKLGCGGFSDWLDREADGTWYTNEPNGTPVFAMCGKFEALIWPDRCHQFTFTPGAGDTLALVVPVIEGGLIVDLIAMAAHDELVWGCVTGRGGIAGNEVEGEPLRVYQSAWQWLLWDSDGVLPLDKSAYPRLAKYSFVDPLENRLLLAESLDHADEISWQAFVKPALYGAPVTNNGHPLDDSVNSVRINGIEDISRHLICIDAERFDTTAEKTLRTKLIIRHELMNQGILKYEYRGKNR